MKQLGNYTKKLARRNKDTERDYLFEKGNGYQFVFWDPYAKQTYPILKNDNRTLDTIFGNIDIDLKVIPKNSSIRLERGQGSIEDGKILDEALIPTTLNGESRDEKEMFMIDRERRLAEKMKKEQLEKKMHLRKVKRKIEDDKLKRRFRNWSSGKNSRWDPESEVNDEGVNEFDLPHQVRTREDPFQRKRITEMKQRVEEKQYGRNSHEINRPDRQRSGFGNRRVQIFHPPRTKRVAEKQNRRKPHEIARSARPRREFGNRKNQFFHQKQFKNDHENDRGIVKKKKYQRRNYYTDKNELDSSDSSEEEDSDEMVTSRWGKKIKLLKEMGFMDKRKSTRLLDLHNGDIQAVVRDHLQV